MRLKTILAGLMAVLLLLTVASPALADQEEAIVCLGANLSEEQRAEVWNLLELDPDSVQVVEVTIDDEKALLGKYVPAEQIGSRSISSASIQVMQEGSGVSVSTHNITWVTAEMYTSALATAGIVNARVNVVSPVRVSGTAALAGIFKAYETVADQSLSQEAKDVASDELVTTGELGDAIGQDEAAELIALVKQRIIEAGLDDPEKIREVILEASKQLGITLTEEQIQSLVDLMLRISRLNIDPQKLADSINKLYSGWKELESKGLFEAFKEIINRFFTWISGLFG